MKFSYPLIKKFVPRIKNKAQVIRALNSYTCEAVNFSENVIDVALPPNRYADMASHVGVAREVAASLKLPLKTPKLISETTKSKRTINASTFKVVIRDHALCPRYSAQMLHEIKLKPSPKWIQNVLKDCGVRPINNVVDVMNYVMLELGQPLHAFDADKLSPKGSPTIIVRRAKKGEKIVSIDGNHFTLHAGTLLIADPSKPLAIAGIKGGRGSEITEKTKNIIIEAANFDSVSIYRSSHSLSLVTDASLRFSHGLHPALTSIALERAVSLLCDDACARRGEVFDSRTKPFSKHMLAVDCEYLTKFIGSAVKPKIAVEILERLGFRTREQKKSPKLFVEVPLLRSDILTHEDIAEEIARFIGYQKIRSVSPNVSLVPATQDGIITLRERVGNVLRGFGIDEIKTHSFVSKEDILVRNKVLELENPPSDALRYLRPSLISGLVHAVEHNKKFFSKIKIFEIGNVFLQKKLHVHTEHVALCVAIIGKESDSLFELKGMVDALVRALGVSAIVFVPCAKDTNIPNSESFYGVDFLEKQSRLIVYVRKTPLGFIGFMSGSEHEHTAILELNLSLLLREVKGERTYTSLPRYPTVIRDISLLVSRSIRIGDVLQEISLSNKKLIENVDLVDEYVDESWGGKQSLTFRITFQALDRTLTNEEVDSEVKKIERVLVKKYTAKVR